MTLVAGELMPLSKPKDRLSKSRIDFRDPLTEEEVSSLAGNPELSILQTSAPIQKDTWQLLNRRLFNVRPEVTLRVYGFYGDQCDLSFLRLVGNVRRFYADCLMSAVGIENVAALPNIQALSIGIRSLTDFDFLDSLPASQLTELSLGETKSSKPSLKSVGRFDGLRKLGLAGQAKQIDAVGTLARLEELNLSCITLPDAGFIRTLDRLVSLAVTLGGTRNLSALAGRNSIKFLQLRRIRDLRDISFISEMKGLQRLLLQDLPHIKTVPNLSALWSLRRLHLEQMKGLENVSALKAADSLEEFIHVSAKNMTPADYSFLTTLKTLKWATVGFGSEKKNQTLRTELEARQSEAVLVEPLRIHVNEQKGVDRSGEDGDHAASNNLGTHASGYCGRGTCLIAEFADSLNGLPRSPSFTASLAGVERRSHFHIIIEVNVDIARRPLRRGGADAVFRGRVAALGPAADSPRPIGQSLVSVSAGIELFGPVKADVDEVGGHVAQLRPLAAGVGDDRGDVMLPKQRDELRRGEAVVPDFHRVPQRAVLVDLGPGAAVHSRVAVLEQLPRGGGGVRQTGEERPDRLRIELQVRRQLPKDRPKFFVEPGGRPTAGSSRPAFERLRSRLMCVMNRGALTENRNPGGVLVVPRGEGGGAAAGRRKYR